jgi:hypothetical protein
MFIQSIRLYNAIELMGREHLFFRIRKIQILGVFDGALQCSGVPIQYNDWAVLSWGRPAISDCLHTLGQCRERLKESDIVRDSTQNSSFGNIIPLLFC